MSHGLELNKNTVSYQFKTNSLLILLDGLILDSQDLKELTIARWDLNLVMGVALWILTTKYVLLLVSKLLELMLRLCQDNGNFKLDHVLELKWLITYG
jgi:hypothetical protein